MSKIFFDKSKIKFFFFEGVYQNVVDMLKVVGYINIEYFKIVFFGDELKERIVDVYFIGICFCIQLIEEVFDCVKKLIVVGCFCIGINQVDFNVVCECGIVVFNVFYLNICFVVELVLVEVILLLCGILEKNVFCYCGGWIKSVVNFFEICGKKFGIVGYGLIGIQFLVFVEVLGMQVFFYDIVIKLLLGNVVQIGSLYELLGMFDIVLLYVFELFFIQWMIGEKEICVMKKGGILINVVCGIVVELDYLVVVIKDEYLIGVVIDVFLVELKFNDEEFVSLLCGLDWVILILYIGGFIVEVQVNIGLEVVEKLVKYSDNGILVFLVNFFEVVLLLYLGKYCLLYIYVNIFGVMSEINKVFVDNGINVFGQYL